MSAASRDAKDPEAEVRLTKTGDFQESDPVVVLRIVALFLELLS